MKPLHEVIIEYLSSLPAGSVVAPKLFLHLGSRAAVDQALSRLVKCEKLIRVARGLYTAPVHGRFGTRAPAAVKVVESYAQLSGETIKPHGASAANHLGLTQQVPVREVYLTSGRTRTLTLGRSEILLKHAPSWLLSAGEAARALQWVGEEHASSAVKKARRVIPSDQWLQLVSSRACLPSWMAKAVAQEAMSV